MSNAGEGDAWELLASSLGVEPTTPVEAPDSTSSTPVPPPAAIPRAKRPAAPARRPAKPGGWDDLASALGVEVPVAEPPRHLAEPAPQRSSPATTARPISPPHAERHIAYQQELSPPFEPLDTPDEILSEVAAERDAVESEPPRGERPGTDESDEQRRRRRRRRGRRERGEGDSSAESRESQTPEADEAEGDAAQETLDEPSGPADDSEHRPEFEGDAAGGGKRRRRRRRGRGDRDRDRASPRAEGSADPSAVSPPREPAGSADAEAESAVGQDLADADDDDPDSVVGDKSLHRAIPSWQEAVGMIIAVNMESRARHPDREGPRGRGGRDRGGRDRGGRDRGGRDRGRRDRGGR